MSNNTFMLDVNITRLLLHQNFVSVCVSRFRFDWEKRWKRYEPGAFRVRLREQRLPGCSCSVPPSSPAVSAWRKHNAHHAHHKNLTFWLPCRTDAQFQIARLAPKFCRKVILTNSGSQKRGWQGSQKPWRQTRRWLQSLPVNLSFQSYPLCTMHISVSCSLLPSSTCQIATVPFLIRHGLERSEPAFHLPLFCSHSVPFLQSQMSAPHPSHLEADFGAHGEAVRDDRLLVSALAVPAVELDAAAPRQQRLAVQLDRRLARQLVACDQSTGSRHTHAVNLSVQCEGGQWEHLTEDIWAPLSQGVAGLFTEAVDFCDQKEWWWCPAAVVTGIPSSMLGAALQRSAQKSTRASLQFSQHSWSKPWRHCEFLRKAAILSPSLWAAALCKCWQKLQLPRHSNKCRRRRRWCAVSRSKQLTRTVSLWKLLLLPGFNKQALDKSFQANEAIWLKSPWFRKGAWVEVCLKQVVRESVQWRAPVRYVLCDELMK